MVMKFRRSTTMVRLQHIDVEILVRQDRQCTYNVIS